MMRRNASDDEMEDYERAVHDRSSETSYVSKQTFDSPWFSNDFYGQMPEFLGLPDALSGILKAWAACFDRKPQEVFLGGVRNSILKVKTSAMTKDKYIAKLQQRIKHAKSVISNYSESLTHAGAAQPAMLSILNDAKQIVRALNDTLKKLIVNPDDSNSLYDASKFRIRLSRLVEQLQYRNGFEWHKMDAWDAPGSETRGLRRLMQGNSFFRSKMDAPKFPMKLPENYGVSNQRVLSARGVLNLHGRGHMGRDVRDWHAEKYPRRAQRELDDRTYAP